MNVPISAPKNMQSDARNSHISSLRLSRPVDVGNAWAAGADHLPSSSDGPWSSWAPPWAGAGAVWTSCAMLNFFAPGSARRLHRPSADGDDQIQEASHRNGVGEYHSDGHHGQAERRDDREERRVRN